MWENRDALGIEPQAFTRIRSVRPVMGVSNDRVALRETVIEYVQSLQVCGSELESIGIKRPKGLPTNRVVSLYGSGALIFNEFGQLKFHIGTGVRSAKQSQRLQYLFDAGYLDRKADSTARIAEFHRARTAPPLVHVPRQW